MKLVSGILLAGAASTALTLGATVSFDRPNYTVATGQVLPMEVRVDFEPGDLAPDLFSFGIRVVPQPGTPLVLSSIEVIPALDFFGLGGAPAFIDPDPAVLGAKGNIADPQFPYGGPLLATFQFSFTSPGTYVLGPDFFRTLGPSEQVFIGGNGSVLDPQIQFANSIVRVVPEPQIAALFAFVAFGLAMRRARANSVPAMD